MLFAFASCDNGGSSPAETVKTTATEEQIATTNLVLSSVVSDLMTKVYANLDELMANDGSMTIDDENYSAAILGEIGPTEESVTGSVNVSIKVNQDGTGSVSINNADLDYNGNKITFEGSVTWGADMENVDSSNLVATIDGKTINGKDLVAGLV